jgi:hypothetical protein
MNGRRAAAVLQTARIIHFAMMVSVVLYGVVLWQVAKSAPPPTHGAHAAQSAPMAIQYGLLVVCAAMGAGLMTMGTTQIARARRSGDPHNLIARLQTPMIVRLAGAEVVALGGFAGTFMSQMTNFIPYFVGAPIALIAMAVFFPRANFFQGGEPGAMS